MDRIYEAYKQRARQSLGRTHVQETRYTICGLLSCGRWLEASDRAGRKSPREPLAFPKHGGYCEITRKFFVGEGCGC
jgi:hypothetical protein